MSKARGVLWAHSTKLLAILVACMAATGCGSVPSTPEELSVARFEELGGRVVRNSKGRPCQLYLGGTTVTDNEFEHVVHLTELMHIELGDTRLTDASIEHLLPLEKLQSVDVSFSGISAKSVRQLERDRPELRVTFGDPKRYQGMFGEPDGSKPRKSRTR